MRKETSVRLTWVGLFALLGYVLAVAARIAPVSWGIPTILIRVLIPVTNYTMQFPIDPDWPFVALFMGPTNAVLYGLVGLLIGQAILSRAKPTD
jgi:hypothetical protein